LGGRWNESEVEDVKLLVSGHSQLRGEVLTAVAFSDGSKLVFEFERSFEPQSSSLRV